MTPRNRYSRGDRRAMWLACLLMMLVPLAALFTARAHADTGDDIAFIDTLDHFHVPYSTPSKVIVLGETICESFDAGMSFNGVGMVLVRGGWTSDAAGYLIGASIGAYCQRHEDLIPSGGISTVWRS